MSAFPFDEATAAVRLGVIKSWRADPDIGRFLERRFLRIVPALFVAIPATYLLILALGLKGFPYNRFHASNGSLWTIPLEVLCYVILLVLASVARPAALLAALLVVSTYALGERNYLTLFGACFALGMVLADYPALRKWSWALVGLGIATLPYDALSVALIVAPLSVEIGTRSWPVLRSAGRHGDLSYGVYIYAFPVQQVVIDYMGADASYWALLAVSLPVVLTLAWLSWHFVEAPALGRKPQKPAQIPLSFEATASSR